MNFQSFSTIFVTNKEIKTKLSLLNRGQPHIVEAPLLIIFVADINRIKIALNMQHMKISNERLDFYITSLIDASVVAGHVEAVALELGLSTCYIAGIRYNSKQANKILGITNSASVAFGLSIGYENNKVGKKPKINKIYDERYNLNQIKLELIKYNKIMNNFNKKVFNQNINFTQEITQILPTIDTKTGADNIIKKFKI
jgi:nitroreductase